MTDATTKLAEAEAALHELITGNKPVSLIRNGRQVTFQPASQELLRQYIQELKTQASPDTAQGRGCFTVSAGW